ncbi:STAS domain-containing protein [Frigoriglobus tundricola]|uniref:STAS domain-containing protein n=1 Tax=Frigoriglobus tundricola TaxID=2774151 RepID=UPI00148EAC05|nr:STAS domain-containing protein [Frigoriglobus tundricola]
MSSPVVELPLEATETDGRITVRFPASTTLAEVNAAAFARAMHGLVEGKDRPHLLIDLAGVVMLTSVILAKLVTLNATLRDTGGRLTLFNPTPGVLQVFKVTRLDSFLEVLSDAHPLPV